MKAIGIARVSTKEQEEQGFSIPAQVARIQEYAQKYGYTEVEIYELAESSTKETRKQFEAIVKGIEASHECIALFVETIDRLQRDYKESVVLDSLRKKWKVAMYFLRENLIIDQDSNSSAIMRWDMWVLFAKQYVSQLRDNVKRSFDRKVQDGEWIWKAPLGYININKDDGSISKKSSAREWSKWIVPDPDRNYYIIKAFELFSTGLHSVAGVAKEITKMWFTTREWKRISKSGMHSLLRNPFYYGQMIVKWNIYDHQYKPLISYKLFTICQDILAGRASNERWTQYNKKEFIFKGILHCKQCWNKLSSYTQKDINYVRCHTCKAVHEREDILEGQIMNVFKQIQIPQDALMDLVQILSDNHKQEQDFLKLQQKNLLSEQVRIQNKMEVLYDDRLDKRITVNEYDRKIQKLKKEERDIYEQLKDHSRWDEAFLLSSSYILELANRAYTLFKGSQISKKRELINFIFANLEVDGSNLVYKIKEPFNELLFCGQSWKWLGM